MIRLLYFDDNPDMCTHMMVFCERFGASYDLPGGIDGFTLLRELCIRGNTTLFIFFTAKDSHRVREEAFRNSAFSVISRVSLGKNAFHRLIRTVYWAAMKTDCKMIYISGIKKNSRQLDRIKRKEMYGEIRKLQNRQFIFEKFFDNPENGTVLLTSMPAGHLYRSIEGGPYFYIRKVVLRIIRIRYAKRYKRNRPRTARTRKP
jgi:hypothetical protein